MKENRRETQLYARLRVRARPLLFVFCLHSFTRLSHLVDTQGIEGEGFCNFPSPPSGAPLFTAERRIDDDFCPIARISRGLFPENSVLSGENRTRSVRF